ncbi:hypothetical protein [Helicobacter sp. MIT 05-5294]|uniref:hypothetical protein n=1 Tax=Helicobacter sp. MIT 05-5294 TaxID=1548150 RepID=UPI00051F8BC2|nr:hypothetical protein [Helicobacter sp. MIT 05-5294]TLD86564.1 hypothetical protein LS69_006070 [Helicobacter sp. MIT 05-5294]
MLRKACLVAFLCAIFGFGFGVASEVDLPKNAKIGKTLEGKKLQEVLQKVKDSKKADGTLQITSALTDYSVDRVYTTRPYPLNEWVYIQAFQQANLYTIGWKTATDEEKSSKTFSRQTDLVAATFDNIFNYVNSSSCIPIKEFFWQSGIFMFELMYNYNAKSKLIMQNRQNVFGLDTELVDNINAVIMEQPSFLTEKSFVVYADSNDIVIDIRNTIGF